MKVSAAVERVGKDGMCFVCGQRNPIGLKIVFREEAEKSRAEFTPGPEHTSWIGVFHGGLIVTLLDEAIGWVLFYHGVGAVTAKMDVRFHRSVLVGQTVTVTGEITRRTRKIINARATMHFVDGGELAAEVDATMFVVNPLDAESHSTY